MPDSYIPPRDADLDDWGVNFTGLITAAPATYGLVPADATAIAAAFAVWHAAYLASYDGTTRGPMTIAAKDAAKVVWLATARPYAQTIANNAAVDTADKIALGVNPRTNPPSPIATPTTMPVLVFATAQSLLHQFRFRDATALPSSRAKPSGVMQLQVYAAASTTVVTNPLVLPLKQVATKSPFAVAWDPTDRAKTAYYAGRWITRTGLVGPWSDITPLVIL
jgi:hypothetical protein